MTDKKTPSEGLRYFVINRDLNLLDAVTATGFSTSVESLNTGKHVFQAFHGVSTTPTATILIEGSLDNSNWATIATITLSGSADTDGVAIDEDWKYLRANLTAIAGTSAEVTVLMRS